MLHVTPCIVRSSFMQVGMLLTQELENYTNTFTHIQSNNTESNTFNRRKLLIQSLKNVPHKNIL